MRIHLILDSRGNIVGIVPADVQQTRSLPKTDEESKEVVTVEFRPEPQPGQTVHEVELPSELEPLRGAELHEVLMRYQVKTILVLRDSASS